MPGIRMSAIKQAVCNKCLDFRTSAALWNSVAWNPSALTRPTTSSRADSSSSIIEISRFADIPTLSIASAAGCGAACPWRSRRNLLRYGKDGKLDWWVQLYCGFGRLRLCDIDGQLVGEPQDRKSTRLNSSHS